MSRAATRNRLLAALPTDDLKRWSPDLHAVKLTQGQVLHQPGHAPSHVYFPTTAIVSLLYSASGAPAAEIGMIGNEGIVGASLLASEEGGSPACAMVQSSGWGFRLEARRLRAEMERSSVQQLLLRHTQALVTQMAQTAACARHHSLVQQLCRWLLLCLDRAEGNELATTQALIAAKLGVRRAGVCECAHRLQDDGLIRHARGLIAVLDRAGLQRRACGCYAQIRQEYARLSLVDR
ncbi:MAG: Crp/Fnr family transcriptional regulator [Pseudomonadota bacterium]|nr:Crp/Fnr family transcriptional regulator [Pseudomonadota bacterium]